MSGHITETYWVTWDGGVLATCTYTCVYSEGVYGEGVCVVNVCMWPEPQLQPDEPSVSQADQDVAVELVGTCTIGSTMTPIRQRLMGYFSWLLQKNKENKSRPADKRKVKPRFYGEALTVDDVYQRLAEEEREK